MAKSVVESLRWRVKYGGETEAATPMFLGMLEVVAEEAAREEKAEGQTAARPKAASDQLPSREYFPATGCPAGWTSLKPSAWWFPGDYAEQVGTAANTRHVLWDEPGVKWTDDELSVKFGGIGTDGVRQVVGLGGGEGTGGAALRGSLADCA